MGKWLQDIGYYKDLCPERENYPSISTFTDRNGNGFFSATMCVGVDDDPALIAGAPILPWSAMKNCRKTECRKTE